MNKTILLTRLRDLHEELSSINLNLSPQEHVDEETIDALGQLVTDVGGLVDRAKAEMEKDTLTEEQQDLFDRIVQFRNDHPRVSQFLTQMTDLLAMIGI